MKFLSGLSLCDSIKILNSLITYPTSTLVPVGLWIGLQSRYIDAPTKNKTTKSWRLTTLRASSTLEFWVEKSASITRTSKPICKLRLYKPGLN